MKIRILDITEWSEDQRQIAGDASHEGVRNVQRILENERQMKIDSEWRIGLPFECDAENVDEALEIWNQQFCKNHYLIATEADWEPVLDKTKPPLERIKDVLRKYFEYDPWTGEPSPLYSETFEPQAALDAILQIINETEERNKPCD